MVPILGHIGFLHDYLFCFSYMIYPTNRATAWRNTFILLYIIFQKSIRITYIFKCLGAMVERCGRVLAQNARSMVFTVQLL